MVKCLSVDRDIDSKKKKKISKMYLEIFICLIKYEKSGKLDPQR